MYGCIDATHVVVQACNAAASIADRKDTVNCKKAAEMLRDICSAGHLSLSPTSSTFAAAHHSTYADPDACDPSELQNSDIAPPDLQNTGSETPNKALSVVHPQVSPAQAVTLPALHKEVQPDTGTSMMHRQAPPALHRSGLITMSSMLSLEASGSFHGDDSSAAGSKIEHDLKIQNLSAKSGVQVQGSALHVLKPRDAVHDTRFDGPEQILGMSSPAAGPPASMNAFSNACQGGRKASSAVGGSLTFMERDISGVCMQDEDVHECGDVEEPWMVAVCQQLDDLGGRRIPVLGKYVLSTRKKRRFRGVASSESFLAACHCTCFQISLCVG